jgi:hypothetical protein
MNECCIKWLGGGIYNVYHCSGDYFNSNESFDKPILVNFCPECGEQMFNVIDKYPELAEARGIRPKKI